MDPVTMGLIGASAGSSLLGGLIGSDSARRSQRNADKRAAEAYAQIAGIELPDSEEEQMRLTEAMKNSYLGDYDPTLEQVVNIAPSAYDDIAVDPRLKQEQLNALNYLAEMKGGLTADQEAVYSQLARSVSGQVQGQQGQILQEMQARGQGGAGAELIARLKSAQSGADRMSQESMRMAGDAATQQRLAIEGAGQLAGQMHGQERGEKERAAAAENAIRQFAAQNQQNVMGGNVARQNQAAQYNLGRRENVSNQNAGLLRDQERQRINVVGSQYDREFQKRNAMAGAKLGQAQAGYATAARQAQTGADIGSAVGSGIARIAAAGYKADDDPIKTGTNATGKNPNWLIS